MSTQTSSNDAPTPEGAFHWQPSDAALLQPAMLAIPKVQRAWERKPLAPFSKQRVRVGKVWKRSAAAPPSSASDALAVDVSNRANKRRKSRNSMQGPLKPVKKMRLDSEFGMGARVLQWEGSESPTRKIVTRSNPSNHEMLSLPDEEEQEVEEDDEGDVAVEILDEDGTVLDVGGEELAQDEAWEDDGPGENVPETEFDGTMMHLAELIDAAKKVPALLSVDNPVTEPDADASTSKLDSSDINPQEDGVELTAEDLDVDAATLELPEQIITTRGKSDDISSLAIGTDPILSASNALPEGFVSPAKQNPPPPAPRRYKRASFGSRRRTLPMQFAPTPLRNVMAAYDDDDEEAKVDATAGAENSNLEDHAVEAEPDGDAQSTQANQDGQEWEDVEDGTAASASSDGEEEEQEIIQPKERYFSAFSQEDVQDMETDAADDLPIDMYIDLGAQTLVARDADAIVSASSKPPSSPVPTIEGQHPRLPLRRSPRRKSSSPMKKSAIMPSTATPHLVAFTPVKLAAQSPSPFSHPGQLNAFAEPDESQPEPASPFERASSDPPEEPQMSPQKPSKPRVSDDTALLQAFLNRAAESKNSRLVSTTKRESMTNRRDSDAVRQALASPAKADVLADLDPNSPSPRKPAAPAQTESNVNLDAAMIDPKKIIIPDEEVDDSKPITRARTGGRNTRTSAQASMPAGPNRIAIRGNTDGIVLKRSEAQETALLTRNNTRKNKGGAILPPIKLAKLNLQTSGADADAAEDDDQDVMRIDKARDGKKVVKWSETLVEFYQGGETSESSILTDELNALEQITARAESESDVAGPPPPSDTPSKPKIRRLKPTRTAATPGKAPPASKAEPEQPVTDEPAKEPAQSKAAPMTKRRSRIATPAKGLGKTSLLPADLDPEPMVPAPTAAADQKMASKKKPAMSKLPAPASTSISTSTSALGQGKENLISSPPKKRAPPPPSAKSFAPKLDLGKKPELEEAPAQGLMSPAKKGGAMLRKGAASSSLVFGNAPVINFGNGKEAHGPEIAGLSSPAKKRTRRAVPY